MLTWEFFHKKLRLKLRVMSYSITPYASKKSTNKMLHEACKTKVETQIKPHAFNSLGFEAFSLELCFTDFFVGNDIPEPKLRASNSISQREKA